MTNLGRIKDRGRRVRPALDAVCSFLLTHRDVLSGLSDPYSYSLKLHNGWEQAFAI
jgi:hypothetical protein